MRKLLTILGAIGLTAVGATPVVSCGTQQKDDNKDKDGTDPNFKCECNEDGAECTCGEDGKDCGCDWDTPNGTK